jgi:hypothetical protein
VESMDLDRALDDALAVVHEWDGGTLEEKLAAFGFDTDDVRRVAEERFVSHRESPDYSLDFEDPDVVALFAAAFAEGLMGGAMFERQR